MKGIYEQTLSSTLPPPGVAAGQRPDHHCHVVWHRPDSTGAAAVGAEVTVVEAATGLTRSATANRDGIYNIVLLPAGTYNVSTSLAGFSSAAQFLVIWKRCRWLLWRAAVCRRGVHFPLGFSAHRR